MCTGTHDFIPAADTAKFSLIFNNNGNLAMNIFHARTTSGFTTELLQAGCEYFRDWWDDNMKGQAASTCTLVRVEGLDISTDDGLTYVLTAGMPIAGTNSNPQAPANVTVAIKLNSEFSGRSRRGRFYVVGLTEGNTVGNVLESGTVTALQTAANALIEEIDPALPDGQLVVVSYCADKHWRDEALVTNIVSATINTDLDSQRRRLNTRGL